MSDELSPFERGLRDAMKARAAQRSRRRDPATVAATAMASPGGRAASIVPMLFTAVLVLGMAVVLSVPSNRGPGAEPIATAGRSPAATGPVAPTAAMTTEVLGSLRFDVPQGWRIYPRSAILATSGLMGYVSMVDVDDPCSRTGPTESCDLTPYHLAPDSAAITVETGGNPRTDPLASPPSGSEVTTIGGMPAFRHVSPSDSNEVDTVVRWVVAMPGTIRNYYRLTAEIRGPSDAPLLEAVDAIVEGMRFADPATALLDDAAGRNMAVATGLTQLAQDSEAYECVPAVAGEVREATIPRLPTMGLAEEPLRVTCSYDIEPTSRALWRMTVMFEWLPTDARPEGVLQVVAWLNPDGTVVGTEASLGR
jgi:hypothetical protein